MEALEERRVFAAGDLDLTFGFGGKIEFNGGNAEIGDSAVQSDGGIVVLAKGSGDLLLRTFPDGSLDTTFGGTGVVSLGNINDYNTLAVQTDGKIVVAGSSIDGKFLVARYLQGGSLDSSFSGDGIATVDFSQSTVTAVAVQSDGKIVLVGNTYGVPDNADFAVSRLNSNGTLDTSFGSSGKRNINVGLDDAAADVAIQADGKIVIVGNTYSNATGDEDYCVLRLTTSGSLDTSFSGDGKATADHANDYEYAESVAIQSDGKILVGGAAVVNVDANDLRRFSVARFNSNGTLDSSFDVAGWAVPDVGPLGSDSGETMVLQNDGKIVLGGSINNSTAAALTRFLPNGKLDPSFGVGGILVTSTVDSSIDRVLIQPDGRLVTVGRSSAGDIVLARYFNDLPDRFEPNDTLATPKNLGVLGSFYADNLSIHSAYNDDFYKFTAGGTGPLQIYLDFSHALGDVDLIVYDSNGQVLARSTSSENHESVTIDVQSGRSYAFQVYGYLGDTNPDYSIDIDGPSVSLVYHYSVPEGGTVTNSDGTTLTVPDSDIIRLVVEEGGYYHHSTYFDGSDVGLSGSNEDVYAFTYLPDGRIVISTYGSFSVSTNYVNGSGSGATITGAGEDLLVFTPTSLGDNTSGTWAMYFDGSDVGLSGSSENIDAVAVLPNGQIVISVSDSFAAGSISGGQDEDLFVFTPAAGSTGTTTKGTWAWYLDGSDIKLDTSSEDIDALVIDSSTPVPTLYLSVVGDVSVTGVIGRDEDVLVFRPTQLGSTTTGTFDSTLAFDGSTAGLSALDIDGIYFGVAPNEHLLPQAPSALTALAPASVDQVFAVSANNVNQTSSSLANTSANSSTRKSAEESFPISAPVAADRVFGTIGTRTMKPAMSRSTREVSDSLADLLSDLANA